MCSEPFGFAVAAGLVDLARPQAFRRVLDGSCSQVVGTGVTVAVRHFATTPESLDERQPLDAANMLLAYEGRVDNRREIAYALGRPEIAHFADGAVLMAAYGAWGPTLSARVIGEYAYVVFDRRQRYLVAGHDSMGVRRIFYRVHGDQVWITSNLRLLFERFPAARPAFDRDVLREYFAGIMSPWSGRTIWRGVRELGRGKVLIQRRNACEEHTAWQPNPHRFRLNATDVEDAFRALLFDAVRVALRSPGPVLCDLSGGYDSSTVCSVAARLTHAGESRRPIIAWSWVNRRSSESSCQEAVREQYDLECHALDVGDYLPFRAFNDTELPTGGFIQVGALGRAIRALASTRGIRSRVTGHAADALFQKGCLSPVYLSEWLREGRIREWAREFAAYLRGGSFNAWHLLRDCSVGSLDPHAGTLRLPLPTWLTRSFRREIREAEQDFRRPGDRAFSSDARERVFRSTLSFIPYHGELLPDERVPFAYRPLVEFILGLDWTHLVRPNEDRLLMRRALRGILPEAVRTGGGRSDHSAVILEGLRAFWPRIAHLLTGDQLAELGVIERKPFQEALRAMRAGYAGPNIQFSNTALYLEAWLNFKTLSLNVNASDSERFDGQSRTCNGVRAAADESKDK